MAAFRAVAGAAISADGLTLTLEDASDYTGNDEGYTTADFIRQAVLTDAYTTVIATIPFTGAVLTQALGITKDMWVNMSLQLVGVAAEGDYTDVRKIACDRIAKNLFKTMLLQGCCANNIIEKRLELAGQYLLGAGIEELAGNGAGFNVDISSAYSYLTGPKF